MLDLFDQLLSAIDDKISDLDPSQIQLEFDKIPLDVFGRIQVDRPAAYPNLMNWLSPLPSADIQTSWTGCADHALMTQSMAFVRTVVGTYHAIAGQPLRLGQVLDFGCGWGRLIRLLNKYVPEDRIHGVDPWHRSIEICRETRVRANLFVSDYIPRALPTPEDLRFDLVVAFSVFTHLSAKVATICAQTLRDHLTDTGVIAMTIRPVEYWDCLLQGEDPAFDPDFVAGLKEAHLRQGFAFLPHNREKIEGEVTYGDTSMSLDFIRENFTGLEIVALEFNEADPLQLIVFLRKAR